MKKRIISFFAILLIAVVSLCGLVTFAFSANDLTVTATNESLIASTANGITSIDLINGYCAVSAVQSADKNNWKHIEAGSYLCTDPKGKGKFDLIAEDSKNGTNPTLSFTISTTGATNLIAAGQIGYTNIGATGAKDTLILTIRKDNKFPFVNYYQ